MSRGTRPRRYRIDVWCTNEELAEIKARAKDTGLSSSEFLRNLAYRHAVKHSSSAAEAVRILAKIHADQSHLRDMLKLCLADRRSDEVPTQNVRALVQRIEGLQPIIADLVMREARLV